MKWAYYNGFHASKKGKNMEIPLQYHLPLLLPTKRKTLTTGSGLSVSSGKATGGKYYKSKR